MDRAVKVGEHCETFYANLPSRIKQFQDTSEKEGKTDCDKDGNLISCFDRDNRYPMPDSIGDFYVRKELLEKEREAKILAEKKAAALKAARMADKHFLANLPGIRREPPRKPTAFGGFTPAISGPKAIEEAPDSEEEILYSPTDSEEEPDDDKQKGRKASVMGDAHHQHSNMKDVHASDGEEDEDTSDSEEEPEQNEEDDNWQKEFELLKASYGNNKDGSSKLKISQPQRRKNITQDMVSTQHMLCNC
jgi:hypothetical protein